MATGPIGFARSSTIAFCVLLSCFCLALAFGSARAVADEPTPYDPPSFWAEPEPIGKPCPAAPEPILDPPPPGEEEEPAPEVDPVVRELRAQRIEAVEICEAQAAAARDVQRRLWWSVAEVEPLSGIAETTNERLVSLLDSSCGNPCAIFGEGGHIEVSALPEGEGGEEGVGGITEAQMVELVSSIDSGAEGSQTALYLLAGLVVALFMGSALARTVDRGT